MEKKPNMSNVDELCIKYVFDELDPSEITLVEQAMIHDQNLLIEVESLKRTWKKIRNLPELKPPANLSEAIIDHAVDYSSQQQFFGSSWRNPGLLATAAIVLFSLMISTAYLLPSDTNNGNPSEGAGISASVGAQAPGAAMSEESYQELLRIWNGHNNLVNVGTQNDAGVDNEADSLQGRGVLPIQTEASPMIFSPAFRDFQLTGNRY
jgi:hypothetical protein